MSALTENENEFEIKLIQYDSLENDHLATNLVEELQRRIKDVITNDSIFKSDKSFKDNYLKKTTVSTAKHNEEEEK